MVLIGDGEVLFGGGKVVYGRYLVCGMLVIIIYVYYLFVNESWVWVL